MNKNLILVVAINDLPFFKYTLDSIEKYSKKIKSDFIVLDKEIIAGYPHLTKLECKKYLKEYDRVLYLDADIIVNPDAPDIFSIHDDEESMYAFNEGLYMPDRFFSIVKTCATLKFDWRRWKMNEVYTLDYYNTGVFIVSQYHAGFFNKFSLDDYLTNKNLQDYYEQSYMNLLIQKHGIKMKNMSELFNRMSHLGVDGRFEGYFIHYAGYQNRDQIIEHDYKTLYKQ